MIKWCSHCGMFNGWHAANCPANVPDPKVVQCEYKIQELTRQRNQLMEMLAKLADNAEAMAIEANIGWMDKSIKQAHQAIADVKEDL